MQSVHLTVKLVKGGSDGCGTDHTIQLHLVWRREEDLGEARGTELVENIHWLRMIFPGKAWVMFLGEFCCLLAYFLSLTRAKPIPEDEKQPPMTAMSILGWALPALCDSTATSTMYVALTMTYASSFQMLRGAVVIFTGIASIIFLKRKLKGTHWAGMLVVLLGLLCVGGAAFFGSKTGGAKASNEVLGDLLIIAAQVIVAVQMVVEEKLMTMYKTPPLKAVGLEGFFGMIFMMIFCTIFYRIPFPDRAESRYTAPFNSDWQNNATCPDSHECAGTFENVYDGIAMFNNNDMIKLALIGTVCSISLFNYSGLSVTKEMCVVLLFLTNSFKLDQPPQTAPCLRAPQSACTQPYLKVLTTANRSICAHIVVITRYQTDHIASR